MFLLEGIPVERMLACELGVGDWFRPVGLGGAVRHELFIVRKIGADVLVYRDADFPSRDGKFFLQNPVVKLTVEEIGLERLLNGSGIPSC